MSMALPSYEISARPWLGPIGRPAEHVARRAVVLGPRGSARSARKTASGLSEKDDFRFPNARGLRSRPRRHAQAEKATVGLINRTVFLTNSMVSATGFDL